MMRNRLFERRKNIFGYSYTDHRNRILFSLDELPKIPDFRAKVRFTHILLPHKPFVFGPEGQFWSWIHCIR
jgi:hypothetical protein